MPLEQEQTQLTGLTGAIAVALSVTQDRRQDRWFLVPDTVLRNTATWKKKFFYSDFYFLTILLTNICILK